MTNMVCLLPICSARSSLMIAKSRYTEFDTIAPMVNVFLVLTFFVLTSVFGSTFLALSVYCSISLALACAPVISPEAAICWACVCSSCACAFTLAW